MKTKLPLLYLCGPINGRTDDDARGWREAVKALWGEEACLDPMRRDYRGRELEPGIAAEIVAGDIEDIQRCDALLVYFDQPSVGTAMEVFYAKHVLGKLVIVIDASERPLSPWLVHHSDFQTRRLDAALVFLRASEVRRDDSPLDGYYDAALQRGFMRAGGGWKPVSRR